MSPAAEVSAHRFETPARASTAAHSIIVNGDGVLATGLLAIVVRAGRHDAGPVDDRGESDITEIEQEPSR